MTDGTAAGTSELNVAGASSSGLISANIPYPEFTVFGSKVLFSGVGSNGIDGLWVTDGTAAGTSELSVAGADASGLFTNMYDVQDFTVVGSKVLFDGYDADGKVGLWVTDGTSAGTSEIATSNADEGLFPGTLTVLQAPCYLAGTRITTERGAVAVEEMRIGDRLLTAGGGARPIAWTGHRRVDCRRHPRPCDVLPVRVRAGAFGDEQPHRDLFLSPDHAVFVDGVLIPVRYLINGATIVQGQAEDVTYWHVELDRHDVILAEGLPCESYLDTGNRGAFTNGDQVAHMHPDFALKVWEAEACAPLVLDGSRLVAAKRRLLARATALGHAMTDDPGLSVLANGRELATETDGLQWRVRLPKATKNFRLTSRVWRPAHTRPAEHDTRRLGVAIARLWLDRREVSLESPGLSSGWHAPELAWRWTDGDATLVPTGVRELAFEVAMTGTYWRNEGHGEALVA